MMGDKSLLCAHAQTDILEGLCTGVSEMGSWWATRGAVGYYERLSVEVARVTFQMDASNFHFEPRSLPLYLTL